MIDILCRIPGFPTAMIGRIISIIHHKIGYLLVWAVVLFSLNCVGETRYSVIKIKHRVPGPGPLFPAGDLRSSDFFVVDKVFIFEKKVDPRTEIAIQSAVSNKWGDALRMWKEIETEYGSGDCFIQSNLAIAHLMTGNRAVSMEKINNSLTLCPENTRIRHNFRTLQVIGDGD